MTQPQVALPHRQLGVRFDQKVFPYITEKLSFLPHRNLLTLSAFCSNKIAPVTDSSQRYECVFNSDCETVQLVSRADRLLTVQLVCRADRLLCCQYR
jgi:hypothetical protein